MLWSEKYKNLTSQKNDTIQTMEIPFNTDSLAKQISVKSAVNPTLWACVVISLPLFILGASTHGIKSFVFIGLGLIPVATFVYSYIYLLMTAPNFLRSEEYQIRAESLKLLGDKDNMLQARAGDVVAIISNPQITEGVSEQVTDAQTNKLLSKK